MSATQMARSIPHQSLVNAGDVSSDSNYQDLETSSKATNCSLPASNVAEDGPHPNDSADRMTGSMYDSEMAPVLELATNDVGLKYDDQTGRCTDNKDLS
ncbi:hypothetical protein PUNSTDRAFT_132140 [Punctularia strigosozonata HHB-11173 SS5]|uniref:uncharacterized protein n=1 Tax=Punctularia strigosozonata (strain HHB-11173) TaxID=741275 RepID=UPI0004416DAF|nr:uncharacterized protein PUNSTDRAFT_132140 [Punctularia strigosozonata HHB-11173 SS5]EIN12002.1 hypothetical protein PUNSTDRAFT_132140 [Punctularia strigosozonata HHB-11173 SS5]